jgi:iron complex transport system substrate-binding protein
MNLNVILSILLSFSVLFGVRARTITDMAGRKVLIPDVVTKVLPYDNKTNVLLFPVAGKIMIAKARSMESPLLKYVSKEFLQLKEVDTKNSEEVLKLKPEIIIVAAFVGEGEDLTPYLVLQSKTKIPLVFVDLDLMHLDRTYIFLGQLLGNPNGVIGCVDFIKSIYNDCGLFYRNSKLKPRAYLANDNNGLRTAPEGSNHAQIFEMMKLQNVAKANLDAKGFANVSPEQILIWNPDYIFCIGKGEENPYRTLLKSPSWRNINAVKNKQVIIVPSEPYLWFDMPPSVNRIAGLIWFNGLFYGQTESVTKQKITDFYRIFYKYNLTDKEYKGLYAWQ